MAIPGFDFNDTAVLMLDLPRRVAVLEVIYVCLLAVGHTHTFWQVCNDVQDEVRMVKSRIRSVNLENYEMTQSLIELKRKVAILEEIVQTRCT